MELPWCMLVGVTEAIREGRLCVSSLEAAKANYMPFIDKSSPFPMGHCFVRSVGGSWEDREDIEKYEEGRNS